MASDAIPRIKNTTHGDGVVGVKEARVEVVPLVFPCDDLKKLLKVSNE